MAKSKYARACIIGMEPSKSARACIEHTNKLPGKQHRNAGIGTSAPTNYHGGGSSPFIRKDYEVHQPVATDSNPVRGHDQMAMAGGGPGPLKGVKKRG
jgi:hypothetical protein